MLFLYLYLSICWNNNSPGKAWQWDALAIGANMLFNWLVDDHFTCTRD